MSRQLTRLGEQQHLLSSAVVLACLGLALQPVVLAINNLQTSQLAPDFFHLHMLPLLALAANKACTLCTLQAWLLGIQQACRPKQAFKRM